MQLPYGPLLSMGVEMYRRLFACLVLSAGSSYAAATELDLELRSRMAYLEDDSAAGRAGTVRFRADWQKQWLANWSTQLELDLVQGFWRSDFSDGVHFNGEPMMPDPEGADLNQLSLTYKGNLFTMALGRQVINLDNERFVGSNGFWQNEQSFDAVQFTIPLLFQSQVSLIYLDRALRIFGPDAGPKLSLTDNNYAKLEGERPLLRLGEHDLDAYLLDMRLGEWDYHKVKVFYHDYGNLTFPAISHTTIGAQHRFNYRFNHYRFESELVAATQERNEMLGAPSTRYYRVKGSLAKKALSFIAEYEQLSSVNLSGGAISFITPLASLHDFQGWADMFTATPASGVTDGSVAIQWKSSPWRVKAIYHGFWSGDGDDQYGQELDLDMTYKPSKTHAFHLRAAKFNPAHQFKDQFAERIRIFLTYSYALQL